MSAVNDAGGPRVARGTVFGMELVPGQRVKLVPGVERPENEHGEVDEGIVIGSTAYDDVMVSFEGASVSFYDPEDLIPFGEPEVLPPLPDGGDGTFGPPASYEGGF